MEEEDQEWLTSKIKGFSFGDDEQTPWEELAKYQEHPQQTPSSVLPSSTGFGSPSPREPEKVTFHETTRRFGAVPERVKRASRLYTNTLHKNDPSDRSINDILIGAPNFARDLEHIPGDSREVKAELIKAKRALAKLETTRYIPLHPRETVLNIFVGKPFSLELYKTFRDKQDLIDEAQKLQCPDTLLTVTLHAKSTLSAQKFSELLSSRRAATNVLVCYLQERQLLNDLTDLLTALGRHEEAAFYNYTHVCSKISDLGSKTKRLKSLLTSHFNGHPDADLLIGQINLLERIAPIIESDRRNVLISEDSVYPSVTCHGESVLKTLAYLCYHHWDSPENLLQSPKALKKIHKIPEEQFIWVALRSRALKQAWKDCEGIVITKGWLGGKKTKASVSPRGVVQTLHECQAPPEILHIFLQLIDDLEDRLNYARRCKVPNTVIECLVQSRDRQELETFKAKLTPHSPEWFYAEHALTTSNTKWKN
ncbi:spermatogenesis-defective protein 39 homolog [Tigriopus californicus]|uniref:spermatogenesis-defective protein 39 homolog n=1 Tax=Tigriopus californicus TaxID=6832 RepID=UPI0027D9E487|nr:spermatogenesis-defective protein 39 homolog [Tigriopus californicus]